MFDLINRMNEKFNKGADLLAPLLLLLFRINWGMQFFTTGKGKLMNHGDVTSYFDSLHIPFASLNAWFVGGVECLGGLLLLVGLFSRPVSLMLAIAMTVAYWSVTDDRVKLLGILKDPSPFLGADPFFFLLTALLVLGFGPGQLSLDWLCAKLFKKKQQSSKATLAEQKQGAALVD